MVDKINNVVATTQTAKNGTASKTVLKPEQKMQIFEGMTVKDVQENGSEAQKLLAEGFDKISHANAKNGVYKGDGKYSAKEAEIFNNYTFALDKNKKELRAYNKETGCQITIKYNNLDELKNPDTARLIPTGENYKGGKIEFDLRNKTATFDGVSTETMLLPQRSQIEHYTIKNADVKTINARFLKEATVNIINTKNVGNFWDSPTTVKVATQNNVKINPDSNSDIKLSKR